MGIEQINSAISQMDEVTQQNAALVEEAAAAAGSMQEQAAALSEVVSIFKVGHEVTGGHSNSVQPKARMTVIKKPVPRLAANAPTARREQLVARVGADDWEEF